MNQSRWRLPMVAILGAVAIALLFGGPLRRLEWIPYDAYWRWIQPIEDAPPVVVVAVDSASVNQLGAPPWDAATALDLLTTISKGQPAAILYAIPTRDEPLPDVPKPLTDNLRRQLVLGELLVDDANRSIQWELQPLAPSLAPLAAGSGVVRLEYDADGVYRHLNMTYDVGGVSTPSAVAVALRVARGSALNDSGRSLIRFAGPPRALPFFPANRVLSGEIDPRVLSGKVVCVGVIAPPFERGVVTPTTGATAMTEIDVYANALYGALSGRRIRPLPLWGLVIAVSVYSLVLAFLIRRIGSRRALPLLPVLLVGVAAADVAAFVLLGWWVYLFPFVVVALFLCVYIAGYELLEISATASHCVYRLTNEQPTIYEVKPTYGSGRALKDILTSVAPFVHADSMALLLRDGNTDRLTVVETFPNEYAAAMRVTKHAANSAPYQSAREEQAIVQDYTIDTDTVTLLVPLRSVDRLLGFWALNKKHGRDHFRERKDAIDYLSRQMVLEIVRHQATEDFELGPRSVARRLLDFFHPERQTARAEELVETVQQQRMRIAAALNGIADGVILFDLLGRTQLYNDRAVAMTAGMKASLGSFDLHRLVATLLRRSDLAATDEEIRRIAESRVEHALVKRQNATFTVTTGERPTRYLQVTLSPVEHHHTSGASQIVGIACVLSDVSIYEQIAEVGDILQTISERGRNYLTPIIAFTPVLAAMDGLDDAQRKIIETISRNAKGLSSTFEEFKEHITVDIRRADTRDLPELMERRAPIDPMEVIQEVAASVRQNGLTIHVERPTEIVEKVWGVRSLLRGVVTSLVHLLSEGAAQDAAVTLTVDWETARFIRIDVSDNGFGLPEAAVRHMTDMLAEDVSDEPFDLRDADLERLPLRDIRVVLSQLFNAELTCESHVGRGTRFSFQLRTVL